MRKNSWKERFFKITWIILIFLKSKTSEQKQLVEKTLLTVVSNVEAVFHDIVSTAPGFIQMIETTI